LDPGFCLLAFASLSNFIHFFFTMQMGHAFQQAGMVMGIFMVVLTGALTVLACDCLLEARREASKKVGRTLCDYQSVGLVTCGPIGELVVKNSVLLCQFGFTSVYLLFMSQTLGDVVFTQSGCGLHINSIFIIWLCTPLLCALCMVRHLHNWSIPSMIADVFLVILILCVLGFSIQVFMF
jgi:amino acid permease